MNKRADTFLVNSKSELLTVGGIDLTTVNDVNNFMLDQEVGTIANSINPLQMSTSFGQYWLGAFLSHLQRESYQTQKGYEKSQEGFFLFCKTEFNKSRNTILKYIKMFETLNERGVKPANIVDVDIQALFLLSANARNLSDARLFELLEKSKVMPDDEFRELVTGGKKEKTLESEKFYIEYIEEDLETFKDYLKTCQESFNTTNLSKLVLLLMTDYVKNNEGILCDLRLDLMGLLGRHKINYDQAAEVLAVTIDDIKELD
jgi:hypothetical protein